VKAGTDWRREGEVIHDMDGAEISSRQFVVEK